MKICNDRKETDKRIELKNELKNLFPKTKFCLGISGYKINTRINRWKIIRSIFPAVMINGFSTVLFCRRNKIDKLHHSNPYIKQLKKSIYNIALANQLQKVEARSLEERLHKRLSILDKGDATSTIPSIFEK